jgi:hypothetical protein
MILDNEIAALPLSTSYSNINFGINTLNEIENDITPTEIVSIFTIY